MILIQKTNDMKTVNNKQLFIIVLLTLVMGFNNQIKAISMSCAFLENPSDQIPDSLKKYTKTYKYVNSDSFENFEVEYRGNIVVTPDDKDIQGISKDGFIKIAKSSFGNKRKIYIYTDTKGNLYKEYYEGKKKMNFTEGGKAWLADILPELIQKTGISAEERVWRLSKKGFEVVLADLDDIESVKFYNQKNSWIFYSSKTQFSQNVYYLYCKIITDNYRLSDDDLYKFLDRVKKIESNSTKGTVLRNILDQYKFNTRLMNKFLETTGTLSYNTERGSILRAFQLKYKIDEKNNEAYFNVINDMSIRSEKGNVLKPLLRDQKMDQKTFLMFLKSVERIDINGEKAGLLYNALPLVTDDAELTKAFIHAVNSFDNAYSNLVEDLILKVANRNSASIKIKDKTIITNLLKSAQDFNYNTKKYILMRDINRVFVQDKDLVFEYFKLISQMDNEFLRYNLLIDLMDNNNLSGLTLYPMLDAVNQLIDEDYIHAAGAVLREFLKQLPEDETVRNKYFETVNRIEFNSTREEILRLTLERRDLSKQDIINIIKATEGIDVDVEKTAVLLRVKPFIKKKDTETRFVFNTYAKRIELEYEFNKLADM